MFKNQKNKCLGFLITIFTMFICLFNSPVHAESTGFSRIDAGTNGITGSDAANQFQGRLSTASIENDLYVAWIDTQTTTFKLRVQKYNGTTKNWSFIDGSNNCRNRDLSIYADTPWLYAYNNKLYLTWVEGSYVHVDQYDPSSSTWTSIDNGGIIKSGSGGSPTTPSMCLYNSKLYISFCQNNSLGVPQIRVARYDGNFSSSNTWTFVDQGSDNGLNYDTSKNVVAPRMAVYGSDLLVAWSEYNVSNVFQMHVKKYNGSSWSSIDNGGLNTDSTKNAYYYCTIINYKGDIYLSWYEQGKTDLYSSGIVTKKYNGSWSIVDEGTAPAINKVTTQEMNPLLYTDGTNMYITFMEGMPGSYVIRIKKFNGTSWTFIDGNHTEGIRSVPLSNTCGAFRGETQIIGGVPYVVWEGSDSGISKTKVYAGRYMPCILSTDTPLAEKNLDSQSFMVTLENDTFKDTTLDKSNFQILNAPAGLSIENVTYIDNKTCKIDLSFTGDISFNQNIGLKIPADELNYGVDVYNLDDLTVNCSGSSSLINSTLNIQKHQNISDYLDSDISVYLNGNAFVSIDGLTKDTDYVIKDASTITLKQSYLATLPIGKTKVTFNFDYGSTAVLEINVNNVAYGKTVIEKSSEYSGGYEAQKAVDGDSTTCWSQNSDPNDINGNGLAFPQYIVVDLGANYKIASWAIKTDDPSGCKAATVYGKSDETGADFESIGSFTSNSELYVSQNLTVPKSYRYIKLVVQDADAYAMKYMDVNELEVYESPKSEIAIVTSSSYTVSAGGTANETITNVPYGTTKADFQAALAKGQANQTWDVTAVNDPVVTGDKIVVTAEDGITKVTYTVTVNAASIAVTITTGKGLGRLVAGKSAFANVKIPFTIDSQSFSKNLMGYSFDAIYDPAKVGSVTVDSFNGLTKPTIGAPSPTADGLEKVTVAWNGTFSGDLTTLYNTNKGILFKLNFLVNSAFTSGQTTPVKVGTSSFTFTSGGTTANITTTDGNIMFGIYGDVNGDGAINSSDTNLINKYVSGRTTAITGEARLIAADVNGDGVITAADAKEISNYISGKGSTFKTLFGY